MVIGLFVGEEFSNCLRVKLGEWVDVECRRVRGPVDRDRGLVVVRVGDGGADLCVHTSSGATYEVGGKTYVHLYVSSRNSEDSEEITLGGILCFVDPTVRVSVPESWLAVQKLVEPRA